MCPVLAGLGSCSAPRASACCARDGSRGCSAPSLYMTQRKTRPMPRRPLAISLLAVLLAFSLSLPALRAQQAPEAHPPAAADRQHPGAGKPEQPEAKPAGAASLPADAVTTHTITVDGRELAYTASAGTLALTSDKGERTAEIFYVAYRLSGAP